MARERRNQAANWAVLRTKARWQMTGTMPRVDLPECTICKMNLTDRRRAVALHYVGKTNIEIGEALGVTARVVWQHMTRCVPQIIEANFRMERQRDCDHIADLQRLVLETFELFKTGIEDAITRGDTLAALEIGEDFKNHVDSYSTLMGRLDKNRHHQTTAVIRALCARLVEIDPIAGADAIDDIIAGNPAVANLLEEGKRKCPTK